MDGWKMKFPIGARPIFRGYVGFTEGIPSKVLLLHVLSYFCPAQLLATKAAEGSETLFLFCIVLRTNFKFQGWSLISLSVDILEVPTSPLWKSGESAIATTDFAISPDVSAILSNIDAYYMIAYGCIMYAMPWLWFNLTCLAYGWYDSVIWSGLTHRWHIIIILSLRHIEAAECCTVPGCSRRKIATWHINHGRASRI